MSLRHRHGPHLYMLNRCFMWICLYYKALIITVSVSSPFHWFYKWLKEFIPWALCNHVKMLCFCFASLSPGLICCFTLLSGWRRKQELRLILDHNIQGNSKKGTHIRNHESWMFKKTYSSSKTPASSIANKLFFFFFGWQLFLMYSIYVLESPDIECQAPAAILTLFQLPGKKHSI